MASSSRSTRAIIHLLISTPFTPGRSPRLRSRRCRLSTDRFRSVLWRSFSIGHPSTNRNYSELLAAPQRSKSPARLLLWSSVQARQTRMAATAKRCSEQLRASSRQAGTSTAAFPPTMQVPRQPPRSLSLGSLGAAPRHVWTDEPKQH